MELAIEAYLTAVARSSQRIWILDPFFDKDAAIVLALALQKCPHLAKLDIKILGKRTDDGRSATERAQLILDRLPSSERPRVLWHHLPDKRKHPYAHDRFCIIDAELFHFGTTVGGAMPQLTAVSCGWNAEDRRALDFYGEVWKLCDRTGR